MLCFLLLGAVQAGLCQGVDPDSRPLTTDAPAGSESSPSGSEATVQVSSSLDDPELGYEVLLGRAEELAVRRFGVDVFRVNRYRIGSMSTTAVQTGWTLGPRTYFAVIQEIQGSTPKTFFLLEHALKPNLDLVLIQGNDARQGVDVRWRRDY